MLLKRLMTEEGVALLSYRIELADGLAESEERLLAELLVRILRFLEGEMLEALRREYLASDDPKKRFSFRRADYRLRICAAEREGLLAAFSVRRGASEIARGEERFSVACGDRALPVDGDGKFITKKIKKRL